MDGKNPPTITRPNKSPKNTTSAVPSTATPRRSPRVCYASSKVLHCVDEKIASKKRSAPDDE